ncbi:MAG: hypothetical protein IKK24_03995 [Clostridia bacterium]|nr:hypothetical protein [Clostridia bacterium]
MKNIVRALCILLIFVIALSAPVGALGTTDYIVDADGEQISVPQTHRATSLIRELGDDAGFLSQPSDVFVDSKDNIYVADTGNNRVVKLNSKGDFICSFTCDGTLSSPSGVFVSKNGDIYIADTLNERIVHISEDGEYIEEFTQPESELIDEDSTFQVSKVGLTAQGYIYTIKSQYFMMIDANNEFKGYIGDNRLGFSLLRLLIRTFASKEQQEKLIKEKPTSYYSFDIGEDGLIYATTGEDSPTNQIQQINMVGDNIYPQKAYGEKYFNEEINRFCNPRLVDISVDSKGIIYVIEAYSGKIFTYDQQGNMLTVFGGMGTVKGRFNEPVALDCMSNGDLLVLDKATGYIHRFKRTEFMENITSAVESYDQGKYAEAEGKWRSVLDIDANYPVANKGIGDSLYKQNKIEEAMEYYELSENKGGYGFAFSDYQYNFFREYFGWVVLAAAVIVTGIIVLIIFLKKRADKFVDKYYSGGNVNE